MANAIRVPVRGKKFTLDALSESHQNSLLMDPVMAEAGEHQIYLSRSNYVH
jgi:hypothetical protein